MELLQQYLRRRFRRFVELRWIRLGRLEFIEWWGALQRRQPKQRRRYQLWRND
jgi:hypothetical protein